MEYNEQQIAAITHTGTPLAIIAGAGTGKTTTLKERVVKTIRDGIPASKICVLTFTNKAAKSIRDKIAASTDRSALLTVSTFHALSLKMLLSLAPKVGKLFDSHILGDYEQDKLWRRAFADAFSESQRAILKINKIGEPGHAAGILSRMVCGKYGFDELVRKIPKAALYDMLLGNGALNMLFNTYEHHKRKNNACDYNDLLLWFDKMMDDEPMFLDMVRRRFTHFFVDEYQDTSILQASILKKMVGGRSDITSVGDPNQSIFSFISAEVNNMLDFSKDFPGAVTVKLSKNYRSAGRILNVTNRILAGAAETVHNPLHSGRGESAGCAEPEFFHYRNSHEEAESIIRRIKGWREEGVPDSEIAVLARKSMVTMFVEQGLLREGIPFVKYGGMAFNKKMSVRIFLALLELSFNRKSWMSWEEIIPLGAYIADKTTQQVVSEMKNDDMWDWTNMPSTGLGNGERAKSFARMWEMLRPFSELKEYEPGDRGQQSERLKVTYEVFCKVYSYFYNNIGSLKKSGRDERYAEMDGGGEDELMDDLRKIREFVGFLEKSDIEDLREAVGQYRLDQSEDIKPKSDRVVISTIHSAKGLEWERVVVMGLEDGILPSRDREYGSAAVKVVEKAYMEEEKRLFYVAATRAKDELCVTSAAVRFKERRPPSIFIENFLRESVRKRERGVGFCAF